MPPFPDVIYPHLWWTNNAHHKNKFNVLPNTARCVVCVFLDALHIDELTIGWQGAIAIPCPTTCAIPKLYRKGDMVF